MQLTTPEQIRHLDQESPRWGVSTWKLMQEAGKGAFQALGKRYPLRRNDCVGVLCGPGNNGGDGLVMASHLQKKARVKAFLFAKEGRQLQGDAARAQKLFVKQGGKVERYRGKLPSGKWNLLVDALLGTGHRGPLRPPLDQVVSWINQQRERGAFIVSLDLPTGTDAKTGAVPTEAVRAHFTATFGYPKFGLYVYPAREYVGGVEIVPLPYPEPLQTDFAQKATLRRVEVEELLPHFKPRRPFSHKGDYGKVMVMGGVPGMTGAVALSARAALRSGAGQLFVAAPKESLPTLDAAVTEAVILPWEGGEWKRALARQDAVIFGCGAGVGEKQEALLQELLKTPVPLVLDADGINVYARKKRRKRKAPTIFTPHPKEAGRLAHCAVGSLLQDPLQAAKNLAQSLSATVIFKSYPVLVGSGEWIDLHDRGNPGMATAGMGDVLAGISGTLLAQKKDPFLAATLAVFLLQSAGDAARKKVGETSLLASDVLAALPEVFLSLGL